MQNDEKRKFYGPDMTVLPRFLHLLITHTILSKVGSVTSISAVERIILWYMLKKKLVNIGKLMIAIIVNKIRKVKNMDNKKTHLPFGRFLNKIFKCFKVPFYDDNIDKGFNYQIMGVSYLKKIAIKNEIRVGY